MQVLGWSTSSPRRRIPGNRFAALSAAVLVWTIVAAAPVSALDAPLGAVTDAVTAANATDPAAYEEVTGAQVDEGALLDGASSATGSDGNATTSSENNTTAPDNYQTALDNATAGLSIAMPDPLLDPEGYLAAIPGTDDISAYECYQAYTPALDKFRSRAVLPSPVCIGVNQGGCDILIGAFFVACAYGVLP